MASIIDETTLHISHNDKDYTKELYKVDNMKLFPDFDKFKDFIQTKIDENDYEIVRERFYIIFKTKYELNKKVLIINILLKENKYMKQIKELKNIIESKNNKIQISENMFIDKGTEKLLINFSDLCYPYGIDSSTLKNISCIKGKYVFNIVKLQKLKTVILIFNNYKQYYEFINNSCQFVFESVKKLILKFKKYTGDILYLKNLVYLFPQTEKINYYDRGNYLRFFINCQSKIKKLKNMVIFHNKEYTDQIIKLSNVEIRPSHIKEYKKWDEYTYEVNTFFPNLEVLTYCESRIYCNFFSRYIGNDDKWFDKSQLNYIHNDYFYNNKSKLNDNIKITLNIDRNINEYLDNYKKFTSFVNIKKLNIYLINSLIFYSTCQNLEEIHFKHHSFLTILNKKKIISSIPGYEYGEIRHFIFIEERNYDSALKNNSYPSEHNLIDIVNNIKSFVSRQNNFQKIVFHKKTEFTQLGQELYDLLISNHIICEIKSYD